MNGKKTYIKKMKRFLAPFSVIFVIGQSFAQDDVTPLWQAFAKMEPAGIHDLYNDLDRDKGQQVQGLYPRV